MEIIQGALNQTNRNKIRMLNFISLDLFQNGEVRNWRLVAQMNCVLIKRSGAADAFFTPAITWKSVFIYSFRGMLW